MMVVNLKNRADSTFFERTDTLRKYYEDIRRYEMLSQEEETALFNLIKTSKNKAEIEKTKNKIVESNQRFVVAVAKRYATNDNIMDFISEGNIGLMQAIDEYDNTKGTKFISWAVWYIRRQINLYNINNGALVKKNNINKTYHIISQATNKFVQREYRKPSLDELAEMLKEEYNVEIKDLRDILDSRVISIDASIDNDEESTVGDLSEFNDYSASNNSYERSMDNDYNKNLVNLLLNKLEGKDVERDKTIIKMSFGIGYEREYENQEIAKVVNCTTERVRQIKASVLNKLKEEYQKVDMM